MGRKPGPKGDRNKGGLNGCSENIGGVQWKEEGKERDEKGEGVKKGWNGKLEETGTTGGCKQGRV